MPIFDLFSKRQKVLRGEVPDVYQYDTFPESFRVQIIHILRDALGNAQAYDSRTNEVYKSIHDVLAREYGVFVLSIEASRSGAQSGLYDFFLKAKSPETVVDVIELSFSVIDTYCRDWEFSGNSEPKITPDAAIAELNARLREHGIGYQFVSGQMVRVDSTIVHTEVVRPALQLLADKLYAGANAEFLAAHSHYRHGRYKESLNEALKAFESTLKTICSIRNWPCDATDTSKKLLDVCFAQGLLPPFLQAQFSALRTLLESGVPTLRNKTSGHGQGSQLQPLPQHVAAYGLHLAASSILFLVGAENAMT